MTIPASGPINLIQIYTEFNAPLNTPLTALVRGGAYVPNTAQNQGVPAAPPIGINSFRGSGIGASVSISPASSVQSGNRPGTISQAFTVVVAGAVGPLTIGWSFNSGGGNMTITNPTAVTCTVAATVTAGQSDAIRDASLQVIITDNGNGGKLASTSAPIHWEFIGSG